MSPETVRSGSQNHTNSGVSSESLRAWVAIILSILFVCSTAALFTAGHAYRLGYLYQLGFDLAQLPEDFHETSFWGFSGGLPLMLAWFAAAVVVLLAYGLLSWLASVLWKIAIKHWSRLRRLSQPSTTAKPPFETHARFVLSALLLLPVIYLLAVAYFGVAEFQKAGAKKGKELVQALRTDVAAASAKYDTQKIELWFGSPAEPVVRGYRLLCTDTLCSIYDPDPKVRAIRLVSLANVREIRVVDGVGAY